MRVSHGLHSLPLLILPRYQNESWVIIVHSIVLHLESWACMWLMCVYIWSQLRLPQDQHSLNAVLLLVTTSVFHGKNALNMPSAYQQTPSPSVYLRAPKCKIPLDASFCLLTKLSSNLTSASNTNNIFHHVSLIFSYYTSIPNICIQGKIRTDWIFSLCGNTFHFAYRSERFVWAQLMKQDVLIWDDFSHPMLPGVKAHSDSLGKQCLLTVTH